MTSNPIRKHLCTHCGHFGQGYIEYNDGFEFHCWLCSNVDKIPNSEIPPELKAQKGRYSVTCLKSNGIPQANFPSFVTSPNMRRGGNGL
jgi:uncharacterized protein YlaI